MTATTLDHLLSAVLASPEDDIVRGAYADALDEAAGGYSARAEFIRVGIELANLPRKPSKHHDRCHENSPYVGCNLCEWSITTFDTEKRLRGRERELWLDHVDQWLPFAEYGHALLTPPNETERRNGHTVSLLRRGFVESVYAPLATLIGGECGRCAPLRHGQYIDENGDPVELGVWHHCPACSGTGRTVGILRDVLKCQPVTKVVATDKAAFLWTDGLRLFNAGRDGLTTPPVHPESDIPSEIFDLLEGWDFEGPGFWKTWDIRELADAALSAALIKWAKGQ